MTVGRHSVKLMRAGWGAVRNTNPAMTTNVTGWRAEPFVPAVTWAADGWAVMSRGGALTRSDTDANPMARVAGDTTYRVRARITVPVATHIAVALYLGQTLMDVWKGPFWASDATAGRVMGPTYPVQAGTWILDETFPVPASYRPDFVWVGPAVFTPNRPDTSQGADRVDYLETYAVATTDLADISCLVDQVTIRHGRSDTTTQVDPSSATVDLSWNPSADGPLPAAVEIGSTVTVATTISTGIRPRFSGRITDLTMGWDDAGEATPDTEQAQITAVATLSDLGRRVVGDAPFPVENDAQRVARVATLAGMPLDPIVSDPGVVQIRARDIDSQPALTVMREVAESASGILWQAIAGDLRYADSNHRHNVAVALELDACDVLVTPAWVRNLDGMVNAVSIGYGAGSGGTQPRYVATNPTSQAAWGPYAFTTDTELNAQADAQSMGQLLMRRNYQPAWILSAIPVDVAGLNDADTDRLLSLELSDLAYLTGLPAIGRAPTDFYGWVEGWTETLTAGGHDMDLSLSDYCRSAPSVIWDAPAGTTWNTIPKAATRTWDEALCLGPMVGVGRWDDTPTPLRWDQVAPAVTWDTWVQPVTMEAA